MVSFVEEIVSENLNAEENLPAFLLPLVMVDILPVSFICTAWQKQKKGGAGKRWFSLGSTAQCPPKHKDGSAVIALNHTTKTDQGSVLATAQASSQPLHVSPPTSSCCPSPLLGPCW